MRSTVNALRGVRYVWNEERNFRIQSLVAIIVLGAALLLDVTVMEFVLLIVACALVLGAEIVNTFVEDLLDELHPDHHSIIGKAKDMMAGVVLVNTCAAIAIGIGVFSFHLIALSSLVTGR